MHNQIEIKVENPNDTAESFWKEKVDHLNLLPFLRRAAQNGDWKAAEAAKRFDTNAYHLKLTKRGDRALHIAAAHKHTAFVRNLVEHLQESDLELRNDDEETAFHIAAASGAVEIATILFSKNKNLPTIQGSRRMIPLKIAAAFRDKKMVEYLYPITPLQHLEAEECLEILIAAIQIDMFDIALRMLNADKRIVSSTENKIEALKALAQKPLSGYGSSQEWIWERLARIIATVPFISCFKRIYSSLQARKQAAQLVKRLWEEIQTLPDGDVFELIKRTCILHDAAKTGNVEFLTLLVPTNFDLLWLRDSNGHSILQVAVINRQEEIFRFLCDIRAVKYYLIYYLDSGRNNVLHMVGWMPPGRRLNSMVPGAALQMQRELLWFKEVEKIVPVTFLEDKNKDNKTPEEIFIKEHEDLQKDGEKWMKDTASSCMVVATLIATIAFAAAFTVPGGYMNETGTPVLLKDKSFAVFVISDAVGMFSSTASIMMFLSILTSRYTDGDFLFSLPKRLVFGLLSLFASVVCLVLAFTATFFLAYKGDKQETLPKLVATLACFPVTFYVVLNYKLLFDIICATWATKFMFQPGNHKIFK